MEQQQFNPLAKHFRQPKLYIKLPSNGAFYPDGAIELTETGEYPVYAMTAKDELMMKTPDALLNGQSTVNVIQSCMPNIKNAWAVPNIDLDTILIAIRIATYGETMDIDVNVPVLEQERTFSIHLPELIDSLNANQFDNIINQDGFTIEIVPLTYKEFTNMALKTFEEQRLFKVINDDDMPESKKLELFSDAFNRLTDLNIGTLTTSVKSITFENEEPVTNPKYIAEFFENSDKTFFQNVLDHVEVQRKKFSVPPFKTKLSPEDIANGAPETLDIPITFDQANFFA